MSTDPSLVHLMWKKRSPAKESMGYAYHHLIGVAIFLWYTLCPPLPNLYSTMWKERSSPPAKESMVYAYPLIGVVVSLWALDLFLGISFEIYFGGCLSLRVEFFSALDLVLIIGFSIYLVGYVPGDFLREKISALLDMLGTYAYGIIIFGALADGVKNTERRRIVGSIRRRGDTAASSSRMRINGNDCPVSDGESICERSVRKGSTWIMDTAAQCHATGDLRVFSGLFNWTNTGSWVYGVSGHEYSLPIRGFGTVQFADFTLEHVFYVEGLRRNLICLSRFQETFGYIIKFGKAAYIEDEASGQQICQLRKVDGLYQLDSVSAVALDRIPAADQ